MTERSMESKLVDWLRLEGLALLGVEGEHGEAPAPLSAPRYVEVAEVEGDASMAEQALNLSLQFDFESIEVAREWSSHVLPELRRALLSRFGEQVVSFSTILLHRDAL